MRALARSRRGRSQSGAWKFKSEAKGSGAGGGRPLVNREPDPEDPLCDADLSDIEPDSDEEDRTHGSPFKTGKKRRKSKGDAVEAFQSVRARR